MKYFLILCICLLGACTTPESDGPESSAADKAQAEAVEAKTEVDETVEPPRSMPVMAGGDQSLEEQAYKRIRLEDMKATAVERQACEALGGTITRVGRIGGEECIQDLPDAGKPCSDEIDCLGRCVLNPGISEPELGTPTQGVCEATDNEFGCTTLVAEGKISGTICVD